ncbi:MAG: xanthine dehydrogenase family protein molybdopterin-binding subunit, partial [Verrucomicrobia bacterium]|nr:xanthine dehydrogenase family protein molybdopterin-binding subunit [Verrucomicrobiota bacterium]
SAIYDAAQDLHNQLIALAVLDPQSPLRGLNPGDVALAAPGQLGSTSQPAKVDSFADILRRAGKEFVEGEARMKPESKEAPPFEFQSFGAHFVEVKIDPAVPRVQVSRVVSVMNCGQIINPKTARSQVLGGVIMGIGMALEEETVYDPPTGLPVTRNLADYHVPVNADAPSVEAYFVGEPDYHFNPLGARGLGEIGITGAAAAVANAVFHATGQRVRDLPITPDKLLI